MDKEGNSVGRGRRGKPQRCRETMQVRRRKKEDWMKDSGNTGLSWDSD